MFENRRRISRERIEKLPEGPKREKALKILEQLEQYSQYNPLWYYNHPILSEKKPHVKQLIFHEMHTVVKMFLGGNQSGKTTAGIADDLIQALDEDMIPPHLKKYKKWKPPFLCRIMSPGFADMELVVQQKLKELVPDDALLGGSWQKAYNKNLRVLRFSNGSMFQFMSYDQDVQKMGGATLHRVHYDEEPPQDVREECRIRLVKFGGDEVFTMTPLQGLSWSYNGLWKQKGPEIKGLPGAYLKERLGIVTVDMDDNPYLTDERKELALDGLPESVKDARKRGVYVHFAGHIYTEFNLDKHVLFTRPIHVLEEGKINPRVNVVVGIDPGIRHAAGVVWLALSADDDMVVFDELKLQGKTIQDICKAIDMVNAHHGCHPIYYVIDPASRNRSNQTGRSDQMEFADNGIVTILGQNAVEAGINRIKERLENDKLGIYSECRELINEFQEYRWKDAPKSGEDGRATPVKKDDHLMDALRYAVMSRPYLPKVESHSDESRLQRLMREDQARFEKQIPKSTFGGGIFK